MRDHALFEEQIAQKQREIAIQVEEERAALEARIQELELECDNARAAADGMEKASTRLTRELVKVHEQYSGAPPPAAGAWPRRTTCNRRRASGSSSRCTRTARPW